jgi:hypothetical protein
MQAAFEKMRQRAAAKQRLADEEAAKQKQERPVKMCVQCKAVIRDRVASFKGGVGPLCVKCDGTAGASG